MARLCTTFPQAIEQCASYPGRSLLIHFPDFLSQRNQSVLHPPAAVHKHFFQHTFGRIDPHCVNTRLGGFLKNKAELVLLLFQSVSRHIPTLRTPLGSGEVSKCNQQPGNDPQRKPAITKNPQPIGSSAQLDKFSGWQMVSTEPATYPVRLFEVLIFTKHRLQPRSAFRIPGFGHQMRVTGIRGTRQRTVCPRMMAKTGSHVGGVNTVDGEISATGRTARMHLVPPLRPFPANKFFWRHQTTGRGVYGVTGHIPVPASWISFLSSRIAKTYRIPVPGIHDHQNNHHEVSPI